MRRPNVIAAIVLTAVLIATLPGCTGASTPSAVEPSQDRMQWSVQQRSLMVVIHHQRGIGRATLPLARGVKHGRVRLHDFPTLESFTAGAGKHVLECVLERPEGSTARQACRLDGAPADATRIAGPGFEIRLPDVFFAVGAQQIELRWVDQWR